VLIFTAFKYPNPQYIEKEKIIYGSIRKERKFWIYTIAIGFVSFGFAHFILVSYHFKNLNLFNPSTIPLLYTIAMLTDAIFALILGKLFDKYGIKILLLSITLTSFSSPLLFLFNNKLIIIFSIILWGIGVGTQESIMRAYISNIIRREERATAFGIFNSIYGLSWFLGSFILGYLYTISIPLMVAISFLSQIIGIFIILRL
ncbi:MAG: MFS transporter, partial [candidate division WOR-3 bacterium]